MGGIHYVLHDTQVRVNRRTVERYHHAARLVINESGIQEAAELDIDFEPSYERLTLHDVWLVRGGERRSVFDRAGVRIIQKERDLDQRLFNGTLSALVFVRDVRVGDVIEYAYTTEGRNPVFDGRYAAFFPVQFAAPVGRLRVRLLWPEARQLWVKTDGTDLAPRITALGTVREYVWEHRDVAAVRVEDDVPPWHQPMPFVEVSEYESWGEVARWATPLYAAPSRLPGPLREIVQDLRTRHPSTEARAAAALRFVQDEVRYLGIELGPYSHRPHGPDEVLTRRFGDCKDKSLLLVTILRALGIDARPALVHTERRQAIEDGLPSPLAFDHVIVHARLAGRELWLDPTGVLERGPILNVQPPPFGRALLVEPESESLTHIPEIEETQPSVETDERWVEAAAGNSAAMTVRTVWRGRAANWMRRHLASTSQSEIARSYLNFYAKADPGIRAVVPLEVKDDEANNVLETVEQYEVNPYSKNGRREFEATLISMQLVTPQVAQRSMPLGIQHPEHVRHVISIRPRASVPIQAESNTIQGPAFRIDYKAFNDGRELTLEWRYRSLANAVLPKDMPRHLEALKEASQTVGYWIEDRTSAEPTRTRPGATNSSAAILLVSLVGGGMWWARRRAVGAGAGVGRRRRAFFRKLVSSNGEAAAQAIEVSSDEEMRSHIVRMRCGCGASGAPSTLSIETEPVLYGGRTLTLAKWTCFRCTSWRHAFFTVEDTAET